MNSFQPFHSKNLWGALSGLLSSEQRRAQFIENYAFPDGLKTRFARTHNSLNDLQQELVFTALRDYFSICLKARRTMVSMPSQVVDDLWHEFILFTKDYNEFCRQAFGRYLHHTPAEAMESPTSAQTGIRRTWRLACRKEHINPGNPTRLPLIFAIDGLLHIENGFTYSLNCMATSRDDFCATHIGCGGSGCAGSSCGGGTESGCSDGGSGGDGCGGSSCGGGCGGGD